MSTPNGTGISENGVVGNHCEDSSGSGTPGGGGGGEGEGEGGAIGGISLSGEQLSLVGLDLVEVPTDLGEKYGAKVKQLDLSYNCLEKLDNLDRFTHLHSLVLDNNNLSSEDTFPKIDGLKTLSLNNNKINDLKKFLEGVKERYPQLKYLSMLKNPACTNELVTGRDDDDYQRYRYYVLHMLRGLRFLDSREVGEAEKKEAVRVGHLCLPARPDPSQYKRASTSSNGSGGGGGGGGGGHGAGGDTKGDPDASSVPELPQDLKQEGVGKASFGLSNYVYYGRQSEGNRFIVNEDL